MLEIVRHYSKRFRTDTQLKGENNNNKSNGKKKEKRKKERKARHKRENEGKLRIPRISIQGNMKGLIDSSEEVDRLVANLTLLL